ncbi:alpha/beta hydrolase fold domain-containing protein [Streptomyces mesophilus]|uniref:alpha/beta hydrolase fold domain-containing protein n=1 Tax=Streptomyces mesophilus TaxID=1775132 RepID=UPI0033256E90
MLLTASPGELRAAARITPTTFATVPARPVTVADPRRLSLTTAAEVVARYQDNGFALLQLRPEHCTQTTVEEIAAALELGEPFVPPLYTRAGYASTKVSQISASSSTDTSSRHPHFETTVGQELHCDGTLQDIGVIKSAVLLCRSQGIDGGDTLLFNAHAAFTELLDTDPTAALALMAPRLLERRATFNDSDEINQGPAFAIQDGRLVCRYCVDATDRWQADTEAAERGLAFLHAARRPDSPHVLRFPLGEGQAMVMDNTRISHGRTAYRDGPGKRRLLFRSLHLRHPDARPWVDQAVTARPQDGTPPPFDTELGGPLREILADLPALSFGQIAERRVRTLRGGMSDEEIRSDGAFSVAWRDLPGHDRRPGVRLLICRPTQARDTPLPVILNIHGGGMVAGDARCADLRGELARARALGTAVVAVEYRLAPEHPGATPVEDCYTAYLWTVRHSEELGFDPQRIVLSGNSAGGGLAAGVSLLARDRGAPAPLGQMLQCPMLDDRCDSASARQMEHVGLWSTASNRTGWTALLGDRRGTDDVSCYVAPARAGDLSGLPSAYIDVGAVESLRDEAMHYALELSRVGVPAELHVWAGAFHSFDQWVPDAEVSRAAEAARLSWLRRLLDRTI